LRLRLGINFYKVIVGVIFSLTWAKVMYIIWQQPSYLTFVWFYLVVGSVILKWVLFTIIDRIHFRIRLRNLHRELEESDRRIEKISKPYPGNNNDA